MNAFVVIAIGAIIVIGLISFFILTNGSPSSTIESVPIHAYQMGNYCLRTAPGGWSAAINGSC